MIVVGFDSRICLATTVTERDVSEPSRDRAPRCDLHAPVPGNRSRRMGELLGPIRFIETNVGYTATTDDFIRACDQTTARQAVETA
jgi:hypothetical protein